VGEPVADSPSLASLPDGAPVTISLQLADLLRHLCPSLAAYMPSIRIAVVPDADSHATVPVAITALIERP
jgi:hypothetical protein